MALSRIEQDLFQIVDHIPERDQLPNGCMIHSPTGEENGKSMTMQHRFEPSFSYRDEGSLTPRNNFAEPIIELASVDTSHENIEPVEEVRSQENKMCDDKHEITKYVADVSFVHGESLENRLLESDNDTVPMRLAKHVLRDFKSNMDGSRLTHVGFREPKGFFMTQVMINLHVAVLRDMVRLMPPKHGNSSIDIGCREIVMYTCRSLEMPGVSSISGSGPTQFMQMSLAGKIHIVLAIARQFIETYWGDYDDIVYAECHRQLDVHAKFCVKMLYHNKTKCCIFM